MKYVVTILDRQGQLTQSVTEGESNGDVRIAMGATDPKLCTNSFVVFENVPEYDRQIVAVEAID